MRRSLALPLAIALVALLALTLVGCGSSKPTANTDFTPTVLGATGSNQATAGAGSPTLPSSTSSNSGAGITGATLGQMIFTTGNGADGNALSTSSGAGGPCMRCHGPGATGQIGPDIRWSVLTGAQSSPHAPRFKLSSEDDFAKAITTGVAAGNQLRGMMPHYVLTAEQISGLAAYLKTL